jgi:hypothetical protein
MDRGFHIGSNGNGNHNGNGNGNGNAAAITPVKKGRKVAVASLASAKDAPSTEKFAPDGMTINEWAASLCLPGKYLISCGSAIMTDLRFDQLKIPNFQRDRQEYWIEKTKRKFSKKAMEPVTVYTIDGRTFWILNGQQRSAAAKAYYSMVEGGCDNPLIPVRIVYCKNVPEAAGVFTTMSSGTRLNSDNCFKADLIAKDEYCVHVYEQLKAIGVTICYGSGLCGANETRCANAFRKCCLTIGKDRFNFLMLIIDEAFRRPDQSKFIEAKALTANFIHGMTKFLSGTYDCKEQELFSDQDTIKGLMNSPWGADDILAKAVSIKGDFAGQKNYRIVGQSIHWSVLEGLRAASRRRK